MQIVVSIPYRYPKILHDCGTGGTYIGGFQFLIGILKSNFVPIWTIPVLTKFQFLIGILKSVLK